MIIAEIVTNGLNVPGTLMGQVATLITVIFGILVQIYRENRARMWAKEDALEVRKKLMEEATDIRKKLVNEAAATRLETEKIVRHIGNNLSNVVTLTAKNASDERKEVKDVVDKIVNGHGKPPMQVVVMNEEKDAIPVNDIKS